MFDDPGGGEGVIEAGDDFQMFHSFLLGQGNNFSTKKKKKCKILAKITI